MTIDNLESFVLMSIEKSKIYTMYIKIYNRNQI